jgi:hypothetical protein
MRPVDRCASQGAAEGKCWAGACQIALLVTRRDKFSFIPYPDKIQPRSDDYRRQNRFRGAIDLDISHQCGGI